jgi:folate-binding protein YgfZ
MADNAFFSALTHEGILAVDGPDANKFLQGQLTCNIDYLGTFGSSLGARCTPKGRMLSSFRILSLDGTLLLAMAEELLEAQMADLQKYAVFSKVKLHNAQADWRRFGLSGGDHVLTSLGLTLPRHRNSVARNGQLLAVRLNDEQTELWSSTEQADDLHRALSQQLRQATLDEWLLAQIRAGVGQVTGATRELFIPQMINLQAVGGVSFKKGCYTGQEIVARMQYLGKLKRRLYRLSLAAEKVPPPGTELFSATHRSAVGEVVLAAPNNAGIELLAVVQEDAVASAQIHLYAADGPTLVVLDLPYALDSSQEIQR